MSITKLDGKRQKNSAHVPRLRHLVSDAFTPGSAATMRAHVMEVCDRLLDSALAGPETDLISAYVPESEREPFYAWSRALARPEIADGAWVEELLRYEAPVQFVKRTALEDLDYGGRTYNRGEAVIVVLGSTNRDNAVFADPDLPARSRPAQRITRPRDEGSGTGAVRDTSRGAVAHGP